jgi:hypothetical protein
VLGRERGVALGHGLGYLGDLKGCPRAAVRRSPVSMACSGR